MSNPLCPHYKSVRTCTYEGNCGQQLGSDKTVCCSHLYYGVDLEQQLKAKEQECNKWKHQAELGSDTTDRLAKQLEEKEQDIDNCREELHWLHNQLDQLKEENEILEKDKANLDAIKETLKAQFNQLKKENVELKELVKTRIEDLCDSCGASSMMPMPCKVYEQALQEIYEAITEFAKKDILTFPDRKPKENYKFIQEQCAEPIRQILQILQKCEVINETENSQDSNKTLENNAEKVGD